MDYDISQTNLPPEGVVEPNHTVETSVSPSKRWYYGFEKDLKKRLEEKNLELKIPPPNNFESLAALVDSAKTVVQMYWVEEMVAMYNSGALIIDPKTTNDQTYFLADADSFRSVLEKEEHSKLYDARYEGYPEIWRATVLALSQKNIAAINLALVWVNQTPDIYFTERGMSKSEYKLYLDISLAVQANIDHVYVQQLEIQDSQQPLTEPSDSGISGPKYIYTEQSQTGEANTAFIDKFPDEIGTLAKDLKRLAERIKNEMDTGTLPVKYSGLDGLLFNISEVLSLRGVHDTDSLKKIWGLIQQESSELAQAGCPIVINLPNFAGSDGVVEFEMLIGINKTLDSKWKYIDNALLEASTSLALSHGLPIETPHQIRQKVYFANGTSSQYIAAGVALNETILIMENEIEKDSKEFYHSRYATLFRDLQPLDQIWEYEEILVVSHELGHFPQIDDSVTNKLGSGLNINKLDELRADAKGVMEFLICYHSGKFTNADAFIQAYFATSIDSLLVGMNNKDIDTSATWYAFTGSAVISTLFDSGALEWQDGKIVIIDVRKGIEEMEKIGEKLINLYWKDSADASDVKTLVTEEEDRATESPGFQLFWQKIQEISRQKQNSRGAEN